VDLLGAALCAAGLIAAHVALADALAADVALDHARGGAAGCITAALVVVVTCHMAGTRERERHRGAAGTAPVLRDGALRV
jgi:membrane protein DedA with SNARE-associated domain